MNRRRLNRKPDAEQLVHDPRYHLALELDFREMIPFVLSNISLKGYFSLFYKVINIALLLLVIVLGIIGLVSSWISWSNLLLQAGTGIVAGSVLIIAPHEMLHGAAYRLLGARSIRFGADLKQFIFYVTADRYPVSGTELCILALTPFVVINAVIIAITACCFPHWFYFSLLLLLSHNVMCIGDFAILNYTQQAKGRIFTYDAPELKKSYFFEEVPEDA